MLLEDRRSHKCSFKAMGRAVLEDTAKASQRLPLPLPIVSQSVNESLNLPRRAVLGDDLPFMRPES